MSSSEEVILEERETELYTDDHSDHEDDDAYGGQEEHSDTESEGCDYIDKPISLSVLKTIRTNTNYNIFKKDNSTIDCQKFVFALWRSRNSPAFTREYSKIFVKFMQERRVLNEIEFYLPQLGIIILHSQVDVSRALERLVVIISQASVHAALQLYYIFASALEDYQLETAKQKTNTQRNDQLFFRCSKLLQHIERAIVYGYPEDLDSFKEANDETIDSVKERLSYDIVKSSTASDSTGGEAVVTFEGTLMYKRSVRKGMLYSKGWKTRKVKIVQNILMMFARSGELCREIPLLNCDLEVVHRDKYRFCFDLSIKYISMSYHFRCASETEFDHWIEVLNECIHYVPRTVVEAKRNNSGADAEEDEAAVPQKSDADPAAFEKLIDISVLTPQQRKRYFFFQQQKSFVKSMTDIAEKLRLVPRQFRKNILANEVETMHIPTFCYLPLRRSVDTWEYVLQPLVDQCRPFNTKARCPTMIVFEVLGHPTKSDTASFIGTELSAYKEEDVHTEIVARRSSSTEADASPLGKTATGKSSLYSRLPVDAAKIKSHWRNEGFGLRNVLRDVDMNKKSPEDEEHLDALYKRLALLEKKPPSEGVVQPMPNEAPKEGQSVVGKTFEEKCEETRESSLYGRLPNWRVDGLIAKSNDDVRQEVFIMQLLIFYQNAFAAAKVPVWMYTYRIIGTTKSTGIIQLIPNAISIDELKKKPEFRGSLRKQFEHQFGYVEGEPEPDAFVRVLNNFVRSMAAYSVITYLLAVKDRHNGNIMIDANGHIIHIDFGFVFGLAPGKAFSMEKAPWKLTKEMVEVMGGRKSQYFQLYIDLCTHAFLVARKHYNAISMMMEITSYESNYPSFQYNKEAIFDFKNRSLLDVPDDKMKAEILRLANKSYNSLGTILYDKFQLATNGILP